MADRKQMTPPGHGVAIVIAAHPSPPKNNRMAPPGHQMPDEDPDAPPDDGMPDDAGGPNKDADGKVSPEEAGVVRADAHCSACKNYDATSGICSKVQTSFDPDDGCSFYFEALSDEDSDEPDADDQGGPPDNDTDDSGAPPQAQ